MKIKIINPKNAIRVPCPNCGYKKLSAELHSDEKEKWIIIRECYQCGFKKVMKQEELDIIQPNSLLWKLVYKDDIFDSSKKEADNKKKEEEERKSKLDIEYNLKFKNKGERKFVKDWVLYGRHNYGR